MGLFLELVVGPSALADIVIGPIVPVARKRGCRWCVSTMNDFSKSISVKHTDTITNKQMAWIKNLYISIVLYGK